MQIANELAAAGMPEAIDMMKSGQGQAIWNLSDRLVDLFHPSEGEPLDAESPAIPEISEWTVEELVRRGEGKQTEFKASMRYDFKTGGVNKSLQKVISKSVAAFLNTGGGRLLVGVDDSGRMVGLGKDLTTLGSKGTTDGWELHLRNVLREYLPAEIGPLVDVSFHEVRGKPSL